MKRNINKLIIALAFAVISAGATAQTWDIGRHPNKKSVIATLTDSTLTIRGTGAMEDYGYVGRGSDYIVILDAPWKNNLKSITSVIIEDGVTTIGGAAFEDCYNLTSVNIPKSVTSIRQDAFEDCKNLMEINVSKYNAKYSSEIGVLFNKNKDTLILYPKRKQGAYSIPDSVTNIGNSAFYGCKGLTSINIPNSVTSIGDGAFTYSGLKKITIPEGVTTIGEYAFWRCDSLTNITIGENVESIEKSTFQYCEKLTVVNILNSVKNIGQEAFESCRSLIEINVSKDNANYSSENGVLFNKNKDTLILCPEGKQGTYNIPYGVTDIRNNAFHHCINITEITIPNSIKSINTGIFLNCSSLVKINISKNNANYSSENGVLFNKSKDTLIRYPTGKRGAYTIPDGVTNIGGDAFDYCIDLTSVVIPKSIKKIEGFAFIGCERLKITFLGNQPDINDNAFYSYNNHLTLYYPCGNTSWEDFDSNAYELNAADCFEEK